MLVGLSLVDELRTRSHKEREVKSEFLILPFLQRLLSYLFLLSKYPNHNQHKKRFPGPLLNLVTEVLTMRPKS